MESLARGGTRWKRFAVVMVPSVAATACDRRRPGTGCARGVVQRVRPAVQGHGRPARRYGLRPVRRHRHGLHASTARRRFAPSRSRRSRPPRSRTCASRSSRPSPALRQMCQPQADGRAAPSTPVEAEEPLHRRRPARRRRDVQQHRHRCRGRGRRPRVPGIKQGRQRLPGGFAQQADTADADRREADGVGDHGRHVQALRPEDEAVSKGIRGVLLRALRRLDAVRGRGAAPHPARPPRSGARAAQYRISTLATEPYDSPVPGSCFP